MQAAADMRQAVSKRRCGIAGRNAASTVPCRAVSRARRSSGGCSGGGVVATAPAAAAAGSRQQQLQPQLQQRHAIQQQQQQQQQQQHRRSRHSVACAAAAQESPPSSKPPQQPEQVPVKLPRSGFFISKTEVPAFIPRDDMMDQLLRWALIEAEEGGQRNFGLPMKVHPRYRGAMMWGFELQIIKEGDVVADMSVGFDGESAVKSEWIGQDMETGMPTKEGKQEEVPGKHFEIWKTCDRKVDDDLRATIRAFCTGLVAALNKYYAFGSVFAEEV